MNDPSRKPPQGPPHGFAATGPGFYVWEETRGEALRAARELRPDGVQVRPAGRSVRPGRIRRTRS